MNEKQIAQLEWFAAEYTRLNEQFAAAINDVDARHFAGLINNLLQSVQHFGLFAQFSKMMIGK